jgi:hypothetical protein
METKPDNIQTRLFDKISKMLPSSISLVDELAEVLKLSNDSIYRRLKGETALSIQEIELLCNMYMISFDSLCKFAGNTVTFDFSPMVDQANYKNYLLAIMNDLESVYKNKEGKIIYAGEDIPLFHNFGFPTLAKFKLFYWMKSIMNIEQLQGKKYDSQLVSQEILSIGQELYDLYAKIPSVEIWTEVTPISLFKQIEFFWESGIFQSKEDALAICDDAREEFLLLEKEAELGCKFDSKRNLIQCENNYSLYWSEIEIGNNCILTDIGGSKTVYLAFNTFNKLTTRNKFFCDEIDKWLKNLIKKSNLISGISEKQRYRFFKRLNEALDITRSKIVAG